MEITKDSVVALSWVLCDVLGGELDVAQEPAEFLVGGDDLLEAISEALPGRVPGEEFELALEPEQAFGDYDEQLVFLMPRDEFPPELEEGMVFEGSALPPHGLPPDLPPDIFFCVSEIYPEHVVLDANHPLAGIALRLKLKIHAVRPASDDELAARAAQGDGVVYLQPDDAD